MNDAVQTELVKTKPLITSSLVNTTATESSPLNVEEIIDIN